MTTPGQTIGPFFHGALPYPAGRPGYRVRHRSFTARIDRIDPAARADARFTVRTGLAADDCVTFESVNFPGRYLRHQDFAVRLHPDDRTALFAADATFCEIPLGDTAIGLRSVNYPDRFLTVRDDELRLLPARGAVSAFVVRPPL